MLSVASRRLFSAAPPELRHLPRAYISAGTNLQSLSPRCWAAVSWTTTRHVSSGSSSAAKPPIADVVIDVPTEGEWAGCRRDFMAPIHIPVRGSEVLTNPLYNKGTAFKSGERDRLRFRGLLPHRVMNIHKQKERFLLALRDLDSNIRKNVMLEDLHDRNETLYHRVLVDHIEEMAPLIYTPTVGQACQEFGTRFRRPRCVL